MMNRLNSFAALASLVAMSVLSACSTGPNSTPLGSNLEPEAHTSARLYVLDCGSIQFDSVTAFGLTDEETTVRDLCALT